MISVGNYLRGECCESQIPAGDWGAVLTFLGCVAWGATSSGPSSASSSRSSTSLKVSPTPGKVKILAVSDMITRGPDGQKAVPGSSIHLTSAQINSLRGHHYTAAMIWDAQTTWFNAVSMGARAVFKELGIRVVAQTQYNFDLSVEKTQVDTVMALHPNILLTIADDPVISGRALQTAVTAGTKIVLLSTMPAGWKSGKQYVTMVTGDQAAMGIGDAKALVKDIGGSGDVGILYHDANYFVTNRTRRSSCYRNRPLLSQGSYCGRRGIHHAQPSRGPDRRHACPAPADQGYLCSLGRCNLRAALSAIPPSSNIKVVSMDLGSDTATSLASCGLVKDIAVERTYELGTTMATAAALGMLGVKIPPFLTVPAMIITHNSLRADWQLTLDSPLPADVSSAYKSSCPS